MSVESVVPSNHLILCHLLLLLPSIFPASESFIVELALGIRWPKYWTFSFSNSPSNEYSGLVSFRVYWFDLLAVQGTLKSLLQHCISKALSLPYGPTLMAIHDYCKNHSFDIWTFVGKVMSLLFNIFSSFVIVFLPRSKHLLISWLQSLLSAVILEPKKIKSVTASTAAV